MSGDGMNRTGMGSIRGASGNARDRYNASYGQGDFERDENANLAEGQNPPKKEEVKQEEVKKEEVKKEEPKKKGGFFGLFKK